MQELEGNSCQLRPINDIIGQPRSPYYGIVLTQMAVDRAVSCVAQDVTLALRPNIKRPDGVKIK